MKNWLTENLEIFIASLALLISFGTGIISFLTFRIQRKHNRKSLKPIIYVALYDYSNCIRIELVNEGVGPANINKIEVKNNEHEIQNSIYECMPTLPVGLSYDFYLLRHENIPCIQGKKITLLEIKFDLSKDTERKFRDEMRAVLCRLKITIYYKDIYDDEMPAYSRALELYARTDNG